jgi:UPF0755 protein
MCPGTTPTRTFYRWKPMASRGCFLAAPVLAFQSTEQPLHSGEYRMLPGMTVEGLIDLWKRGEVVQYSLTLVEGWNFHQVRAALAKEEKLDHTLDGLSDTQVMDKLGHPGFSPRDDSSLTPIASCVDDRRELLKAAYDRLDEVLAKEWERRAPDAPYTDPIRR